MAANFTSKFLGIFPAWWKRKGSPAISLGITAAALLVYLSVFVGERPTQIFEFIHRLELASLDTRFRLRGKATPDPRIVIVDIDQRAQEVLGRWPFPRSHFARMLDILRADGARVVVFDITFSKPDEISQPIGALRARLAEHARHGLRLDPTLLKELAQLEQQFNYDQQFAGAIERFGPVVLGNFFLYTKADLEGLDDATLDRYARLLAYFPFPQVRAARSAMAEQSLLDLIQLYDDRYLLPRGAQANIEILTDALRGEDAGAGFINILTDPDGVVRRATLALPYGRSANRAEWDLYPSIEVQAVRSFLRLPDQQVVLNLGQAGIDSLEFGPSIAVRPDDFVQIMINYQGPVRSYRHVSIADVVNGSFAPGTFRDKLVLVGASATGIGDLRATPYGAVDYPGVEIHANVIDNILNQKFLLRGAQQAVVDLLFIFLFGIPVGIWLALTQPRWMVLAVALLLPFGFAVQLAFHNGWWLNFITPSLFTLVPNTGLVALYRVLVEEREKRKVRGAFQHYISPEVIRRLLDDPERVKPRKTEITVMFSDIRGFTAISEQLDAQEIALFLNGYLTDMTRIVFRHQGTLDKYIGDAVMAFWGAPFEEPGHGPKSCRAGLEMLRRTRELQQEWAAQGKPVLDIGLGINTGMASVGNMGSQLRYGYTAMGDAVNLASRLEGLNKEYGTHILISESAYAAARGPEFLFRELDVIRVKGKLQPVTIYELLGLRDGTSDLVELVELFAEARACYKQRDWHHARSCFAKVLARWPDDGPARAFLQRCEEFLREEPAPDWDGVYVMKHK